MIGYYDLSRCPPTFDAVTFLMGLEHERLARGEHDVEIEILPGPAGGFRRDPYWPWSIDERRALLQRIVVPMCWMLPSCRDVTIRSNRPPPAPNSWGYGQYTIGADKFFKLYRYKIRPLRPKVDGLADPRLVTLTLREAEHWPQRNVKLAQWRAAALELMSRCFEVIVLRDTRLAHEPLPGVHTDPVASINLQVRAALYRSAICNVFINNGPAWFSFALDAPTLIIRPATEGIGPLYGAARYRALGLGFDGQLPGAPDHQRLVWADDSADNIVNAVCKFTDRWTDHGSHQDDRAAAASL